MLITFLLWGCSTSQDEWITLVNDDLDGWHVYGSGTDYNGWHVDNGTLKFSNSHRKDPQRTDLITNKKYTNFELSLEWKIGEFGNSGVFWAVVEDERYEHAYDTGPEIQILDENWTEYIEQNGDKTRAGALFGILAPSEIVSKAGEEWNHFLLHVDHVKNEGWLRFNDQEVLRFPVHGPVWDSLVANSRFAEWPGYGKSRTGHICLQEYGGEVSFRNVKIRELPDQ